MRFSEWSRIKIVKDIMNTQLRMDETFLTGEHMIGQKDTKQKGDEVSYYKVIKAEGKNVEYIIMFGILGGKGNEDKHI